jgi:LPPG:FO 2-phospho-L-lactate transferase
MSDRVVVLTGGVGGAKLALGLCHAMPAESVTAIVNTGDDFSHLGLWISPDLDTLLYTLSGKSDEVRGWGRAGESWNFMEVLRTLGGEDWFQLGDGDLALHVERTRRLQAGQSLTEVMADYARAWHVAAEILPMSDQPVATWLNTDAGLLPFQRYFVERRCVPRATSVRFEGAKQAMPGPDVIARLTSIDPILAGPGIREALASAAAPVVAVSPLVGGDAVKGPTRKLMDELGVPATPRAIADHYAGIIDALLIDERDRSAPLPETAHDFCDTLMRTLDDRIRVARAALDLAARTTR